MYTYPQRNLFYKKSKGYTLIEVMMVLFIAALIFITTFVTYNSFDNRRKSEQMAEGVNHLMNNIYELAQNQATFSGLGTDYLIANKMMPPELVNSSGTATRTIWGGTISGVPSALNGVSDATYTLTFSGVPSGACADFANRLAPVNGSLSVNGTMVENTLTTPGATSALSGVNEATLSNSCSNNNTLVVTYTSPAGAGFVTGSSSTSLGAINDGTPIVPTSIAASPWTVYSTVPVLHPAAFANTLPSTPAQPINPNTLSSKSVNPNHYTIFVSPPAF